MIFTPESAWVVLTFMIQGSWMCVARWQSAVFDLTHSSTMKRRVNPSLITLSAHFIGLLCGSPSLTNRQGALDVCSLCQPLVSPSSKTRLRSWLHGPRSPPIILQQENRMRRISLAQAQCDADPLEAMMNEGEEDEHGNEHNKIYTPGAPHLYVRVGADVHREFAFSKFTMFKTRRPVGRRGLEHGEFREGELPDQ